MVRDGSMTRPAGLGRLQLRAEAGTAAFFDLSAGERVMLAFPRTILSPPYLLSWMRVYRCFHG
jgi:hypothetical protein